MRNNTERNVLQVAAGHAGHSVVVGLPAVLGAGHVASVQFKVVSLTKEHRNLDKCINHFNIGMYV